jgi:hypothetical protein
MPLNVNFPNPGNLPDTWEKLFPLLEEYLHYLQENAVAYKDNKIFFNYKKLRKHIIYNNISVVQYRVWCFNNLRTLFKNLKTEDLVSYNRVKNILIQYNCFTPYFDEESSDYVFPFCPPELDVEPPFCNPLAPVLSQVPSDDSNLQKSSIIHIHPSCPIKVAGDHVVISHKSNISILVRLFSRFFSTADAAPCSARYGPMREVLAGNYLNILVFGIYYLFYMHREVARILFAWTLYRKRNYSSN